MSTDIITVESGTYTRGVKAIVLNRILLVLSFIGLFVAGALSIEKALNIVLPCGNGGGCAKVAADPRSILLGVPVAYIGFAGYVLFAALAIARTMGTPNAEKLVKIGLGCSVVGALFSIYLQYVSIAMIGDICPYCLTSAVVMVLSAIVYFMLFQTVGKENYDQVNEVTGRKMDRDVPKIDLAVIIGAPILIILGISFMAVTAGNSTDLHGDQEATLANLTDNAPKKFGPDNAKMTIVEFFDMCCPPCKMYSPKVKEFARQHQGKVRIVFRDFPLKMHKFGATCAAMGEYAQEKGKFVDFMLGVMAIDGQPDSVDQLLSVAKTVGLNPADMKKRLSDSGDVVYKRVTDDLTLGKSVGVSSTPTFIIFAPGMARVTAGPNDIMDKLNGEDFKRVLASSG